MRAPKNGRPLAVETTDRIAEEAYRLACERSLGDVTCSAVARRAGVSHALVSYHFSGTGCSTTDRLRSLVGTRAIKEENHKIIAELIIMKNPLADLVPAGLRRDAIVSFYQSSIHEQ